MAWSLVTPASRGIGFHLTRHLLLNTRIPVVATARRDVEGVKRELLRDLKSVDEKRLTVLELDVTDEATIASSATQAKSLFPSPANHLRLAFCIPGILYPEKSPSQLEHAHLTQTFAVNTIGPLLVFKHFSPFLPGKRTILTSTASSTDSQDGEKGIEGEEGEDLPPHAIWLNMAARVGSTSDNNLGGWYSYRASKAGVMSMTKGQDIWMRAKAGEKAMVMAYHPGTVRTGLSEEFWGKVEKGKLFEAGDAVGKMWGVVKGLDVEAGRGRCWDWKGVEIRP